MKARTGFNLLMLGLVVATLTTVGCKKKPTGVTPLPGSRAGQIGGPGTSGIMDGTQGGILGADNSGVNAANATPMGIPQGDGHPGWAEDHETLKSDTVYFDYDSSTIKGSEHSKIEAVAAYLKSASSSSVAVKVEGNCDERGTEEYNRSLGERRALAIREYLVRSGVTPDRVDTMSYGEDRPADPGHGESAWKKNRRGEFIVLTAPR